VKNSLDGKSPSGEFERRFSLKFTAQGEKDKIMNNQSVFSFALKALGFYLILLGFSLIAAIFMPE
jgi:hypothetical protein